MLVQVTKDPIGHKGARLTSHIALSGRHLVYVPNGNASGISRKLSDVERKRLRDVLKKLVPDGAGVIVRTAAEGASRGGPGPRRQAAAGAVGGHPGQGGRGQRARRCSTASPTWSSGSSATCSTRTSASSSSRASRRTTRWRPTSAHVSPDLVERVHRHTGAGDVFAE